MKAYQTIKYLAFVSAVSLWGCSSQQYAQNSEYDDLYFSSKDKKEVVYTASTSSDYNIGNTGVAGEDNSQKNVNPEYIQQYSEQSKKSNNSANNETIESGTNNSDSYSANNSYYDENYRSQGSGGVNLARNYNRRTWDSSPNINIFPSYNYGGYGGSAFYDPFYDPFYNGFSYYDPFFYRPFVRVRPGIVVSIGSSWGWGGGWNRWNSFYDPFYGGWGDPFYGRYAYNGWGDPFYGNGFYNPYRYYGGNYGGGNVIVVNPGNNNGGSNDPRTVRYSPRSARGSSTVNEDFNNSPRTGRAERGGRVESDPNTNPGGRTNANVSADGDRPARAVRPRGGETQENYRPQNTPADYNSAGSRTPSVGSSDGISTPRAVRPRGNSDASNSNRSYDYNSNNRSSAPTYSAPSTGRSPRSYDSAPRNDNWNNNNNSNYNNNSRSTDTYRSNGNSNSGGGSYSSPSSSPRGGNSGGSSPRSPR